MEVKSLAEQLYFTTVRIDTIDSNDNTSAGTGFLFNYERDDYNYPFVVTNKHVVEGADRGGLTFLKKEDDQPKLGDGLRVNLESFASQWTGHPESDVDIAVLPLVPLLDEINSKGFEAYFRTISTNGIPTEEQLEEIDAFEEIVFVGYPNGIWDEANRTPIMRKGTTATPIVLDYEEKPQFLIDASVFSGSSGSPVFIYQSGVFGTRQGTKAGTKFFFVGLLALGYYKKSPNEIVSLPIPTNHTSIAINIEMIDLGIVWKARKVVEMIEIGIDKAIKEIRKQ